MEALSKILEFSAKYAWAVFVMVAFVLFVPEDALKQLGLEHMAAQYKGYFWLALVFTGTLSVGAVFTYLDKKVFNDLLIQRKAQKKKQKKRKEYLEVIRTRLNALDDRELAWIKYSLFFNVQTLSAELTDITAQSLVNKGIVSQGSGSLFNCGYHIPNEVWEYLLQHRHDFLSDDEVNNPKKTRHSLMIFKDTLHSPY